MTEQKKRKCTICWRDYAIAGTSSCVECKRILCKMKRAHERTNYCRVKLAHVTTEHLDALAAKLERKEPLFDGSVDDEVYQRFLAIFDE